MYVCMDVWMYAANALHLFLCLLGIFLSCVSCFRLFYFYWSIYVIISIIAVVLAKFLCQLYLFSRKIMPSSMDLIPKLYSVMWIRSAKWRDDSEGGGGGDSGRQIAEEVFRKKVVVISLLC